MHRNRKEQVMFYRWGPYFERDCQDPAYVQQLHEEDAWREKYAQERQAQELLAFWSALQFIPAYTERFQREAAEARRNAP